MNHVYRYEDGTYLTHYGTNANIQEASVGRKASIAAKAAARNASRNWKKLPKLIGKAVPVTIAEA